MSATPAKLQNVRTRPEWAAIINADWRKSIEGIIQTGRDLVAAKAELPHGEFTSMIQEDLSLSVSTAEGLMNIAKNRLIVKSVSTGILPPSWAILSQLSRMKEADLQDAISSGLITSKSSLRQARAVDEVYKKPSGVVGAERSPSALPSPKEAREIARATGRLVAASDNNTYSGASAEEGVAYSQRRTAAFRTLEAVTRLASAGDADSFVATLEPHWLLDFNIGAIEDAIAFLTELRPAMGVIDAQ